MNIASRAALSAVVMAVALPGCGDSDDAPSTAGGSVNEKSASQAKTADAGNDQLAVTLKRELKLQKYSGVPDAYRVSSGWCDVSVFLDSPESVSLYADAGDPVATNPAETLGVKVGGFEGVDSAECVQAAVDALADL